MQQQVGNHIGVTAKGADSAFIADITADGSNTFTVATTDVPKFRLGDLVVFRVKSTGAGFGTTARTITAMTAAGVITYSGSDLTLVAGTHGVYDGAVPYATSTVNYTDKVNLNGGTSAQRGFAAADFNSVASMRSKLAELDGTTYTDAMLNTMTFNDLIYALRLKSYAGTI